VTFSIGRVDLTTKELTRFASGALAAALLAGCSAAGSPSSGGTMPGAQQRPAADAARLAHILSLTTASRIVPAYHPNHRKSWMLPGALRRQYLLYVSDLGTGTVDVFNYRVRAGRMFGQLTGFAFPYGQCIDRSGNVYIVDAGTDTIYEFAHGGTSPIATASDSYGSPNGCSVDRTTGNVAVSNLDGFDSSPGGVVIFSGGLSGTQTNYADPNLSTAFPPGYDPSGNLYVQGLNSSDAPTFVEMPSGSSSFTPLTGLDVHEPGSVQWDGSYVALTDQAYHGNRTAIYRVTISGSAVTLVRTTILEDDHRPGNLMFAMQPFINGTTRQLNGVVAGNIARFHSVNFWNYANGGEPKRSLPEDIAPLYAVGQSVSPLRFRH
jgi:hypothetical protein